MVKTLLGYAPPDTRRFVYGTFEGGTLEWSVPTKDGTELTRDQTIAAGSFDDIELTELGF